jgi:hypothetical protein
MQIDSIQNIKEILKAALPSITPTFWNCYPEYEV